MKGRLKKNRETWKEKRGLRSARLHNVQPNGSVPVAQNLRSVAQAQNTAATARGYEPRINKREHRWVVDGGSASVSARRASENYQG